MHYFMNICDEHGLVGDEEGRELADDAEAREVAIAGARDVMAGDVRDGRLDLGCYIEVEDEDHKLLFTLKFADALTIIGA